MQEKDIVIVFDCGATNVRTVAIDTSGKIAASESRPNNTQADPHHKGGLIWDVNEIWDKLSQTCKKVLSQIDKERIAAVSVTTFGVDGTFLNNKGKQLYPVISWQCPRSNPIMDNIGKYMPVEELYRLSGVYPHAFNTINKLIWFRENRPDVIEEASHFLFIPSLIVHLLSGEAVNDTTMMGTSMLTDQKERKMSSAILNRLGISEALFSPTVEPGEMAGQVIESASKTTGLPKGIPVFLAGHDTQFAIFGSGADLHQPVLSSGTWEILMARSKQFASTPDQLKAGLTNELDAQAGTFNIGQNWLSSGVLEWFTKHFCSTLSGDDMYKIMIEEAMQVPVGCNGVKVDPSFYMDNEHPTGGGISGLTLNTKRGEIYRAILESLSFKLKESLMTLEAAGGFKTDKIICVGGGSKNAFWNQMRANVCGVPLQTIDQKETTVLGAALFAMAGAGLFSSPDEARSQINYAPQIVKPSSDSELYKLL